MSGSSKLSSDTDIHTVEDVEVDRRVETAPTKALTPIAQLGRWTAPAFVAVVTVVSMLRTDVAMVDIVRFGAYWIAAVIAPGIIVARLLLGPRRTLIEDVAIGAATGLSLEILSWAGGVTSGLGDIVRFWWVLVLVAACAFPQARSRVLVRVSERVPLLHAWVLSVLSVLTIIRLDVYGFRNSPLPPAESALNVDLWWHLSLVQELMRFERPQVPQVAGEALDYHFFSHAHLAMASRISGVLPEVVLLRLWLVPIVLVSFGVAVVLGRLITSSLGGGVATAWLGLGVTVATYVWVDLRVFGASPIVVTSPSQILANVGIAAAAIGFGLLLRNGSSPGLLGWLVLIILMASGSKSTVIPLLIGGTLTALAWALVSRSARRRPLALAACGLLVLEAGVLALASGTSGGKVIVLGTLKSLSPYRELVSGHSRRAVNDGLLIDTLASPRTAGLALLTVVVFFGVHTCRLAGLVVLARRETRADLFNWWLAGCVVAGFAATLVIDHVGLSQLYFVLTAVPLGAALTIGAVWQFAGPTVAARRTFIASGLAAGAVVTLVLDYLVRARERRGAYGALEQILYPLLLVVCVASAVGIGWAVWRRRTPRRMGAGAGLGLLTAMAVGIVVPGEVELAIRSTDDWLRPSTATVDPEALDYVTEGELEAMAWLRDNSAASDVIMTNVHCRPYEQVGFCDTRGFWVVGLSGRRAVLEGWGYTGEAQAMQGVENRVWARQPAPFPERAAFNDAVFDSGDLAALERLEDQFGVRWVVSSERAGGVPDLSGSGATVTFDNGEVTIWRLDDPTVVDNG